MADLHQHTAVSLKLSNKTKVETHIENPIKAPESKLWSSFKSVA
uniref:Uncharacterized protein n=1 Tax=Rhizophora mucronata TaxID=61149 RepID=A0A2P2N3J8_RHIMU